MNSFFKKMSLWNVQDTDSEQDRKEQKIMEVWWNKKQAMSIRVLSWSIWLCFDLLFLYICCMLDAWRIKSINQGVYYSMAFASEHGPTTKGQWGGGARLRIKIFEGAALLPSLWNVKINYIIIDVIINVTHDITIIKPIQGNNYRCIFI